MLIDEELRERLSYYCHIHRLTQERAANEAVREMLKRAEDDPATWERMQKAKQLKEMLDGMRVSNIAQ